MTRLRRSVNVEVFRRDLLPLLLALLPPEANQGSASAGRQSAAQGGPWLRLSTWGISFLVHAAVLVLVSVYVSPPLSRGTGAERETRVGIAIRPAPEEIRLLDDEAVSPSPESQTREADLAEKAAQVLAEAFAAFPEPAVVRLLPQSNVGAPSTTPGDQAVFDPGPRTGNPQLRVAPGGKARVQLFGITGEGHKFVYVFDRSDSMNWFERRPLRAAKAELLASLDGLGETHQFQIIFYNHEPLVFNPAGQPFRLAFGTEENKARARRFVESVTASGGTRHMEAVLLALNLQPDVIFLLTDADDPQLSDAQVAAIVRRAGGTTIHTIEFGYGPQKRPDNFLVRLARLTGGQHVYVDISRL